eukprot:m.61054 g.61054  ORF g.61054 m.61054 type:complete len:71 (+) comp15746_c1_seq2:1556-1768(+)
MYLLSLDGGNVGNGNEFNVISRTYKEHFVEKRARADLVPTAAVMSSSASHCIIGSGSRLPLCIYPTRGSG